MDPIKELEAQITDLKELSLKCRGKTYLALQDRITRCIRLLYELRHKAEVQERVALARKIGTKDHIDEARKLLTSLGLLRNDQ